MSSAYLILNIFIILFPLLLSFEKKIKYYKKLTALFISTLIVGGVFIIWDSIATYRGDWSFNPSFVIGLNLFNLPLEEVLFFITVPYSGIFLYETGKFYGLDKTININRFLIYGFAVLILFLAIFFISQYYTFTVLIFTSIFLFISVSYKGKAALINSRLYWLWIGFMYLPFLVVNYFLTSIPIVTYSKSAIWGLRFITIPLEDFFYSFSLLSFYLLIYLMVEQRWKKE
jgi:lycopene cyclase domain-containing protein